MFRWLVLNSPEIAQLIIQELNWIKLECDEAVCALTMNLSPEHAFSVEKYISVIYCDGLIFKEKIPAVMFCVPLLLP